MNQLEVCKTLEDRNSQRRINAVLSQSLILYHGPLVHESSSDRIGHVAANSTCLT